MAKSTADFDPNMATATEADGLIWHDARTLTIEGQGFVDCDGPFSRLPARAKALVSESVWYLGHHSAGLAVRFQSDAPELSARWKLPDPPAPGAALELAMNHMTATGVSGLDLYGSDPKHGWRWFGGGRPAARTNCAQLVAGLQPAMRTYMLYLPLYNALESLQIGLPKGSHIQPVAPRAKPVVIYGTSIVQGGCASRPGMAYTAILGRRLDQPVVNLGFSGSGKAEIEVAALLAEIDARVYVIDCLPNLNAVLVPERVESFLRLLRQRRAATPIVLVENVSYSHAAFVQSMADELAARNQVLHDIYAKLLSESFTGLYYVPSQSLLGDDGEGTVDGIHPTDLGFVRMAQAIEPVLRQAIGQH